jgi:hypothetical protein
LWDPDKPTDSQLCGYVTDVVITDRRRKPGTGSEDFVRGTGDLAERLIEDIFGPSAPKTPEPVNVMPGQFAKPEDTFSWRGPVVRIAVNIDGRVPIFGRSDDPNWAQYVGQTLRPDMPDWRDRILPMVDQAICRQRLPINNTAARLENLENVVKSVEVQLVVPEEQKPATDIGALLNRAERILAPKQAEPDMSYMEAELTLETGFDAEKIVVARFWSTHEAYLRYPRHVSGWPLLHKNAVSVPNWDEIVKHLTPELLRAFGPDCVQHYDTLGRLTIQGPDGKRLAVASRLEVRKLKTDSNA